MMDGPSRDLMKPNLEIQNHVLLLHARHEGILRKIIRTGAVLLVRTLHLLLERLDVGGKQAVKSEVVTLL